MLACGLLVRDIEDAFKNENGRLLLSKTAVSQLGERLWEDYQASATRDLSEYEITYLFVAVACFMDDFEACIAHLRFPVAYRPAIRTTNLLERPFVEERRRLKIIPNAFSERAVLKLMFGALIRAAERWRAIKVTEFERRQLSVVRQSGIRGQVGLKGNSQRMQPRRKGPSNPRT